MKTIKLPSYGITVVFDPEVGSGTITSEGLHEKGEGRVLKAAIDTLEAFVLAAACAGIDIKSPKFLEAIETTVDGIFNNVA
jgi:hypothetical protein